MEEGNNNVVGDIKNIESEAGVIASVIMNPQLTYFSEQLKPNHFFDTQNGYIYYAVKEIANRGIQKVDAYNLSQILSANKYIKDLPEQKSSFTTQALDDLIQTSKLIARTTPEDYRVLVDNVLNAAFRRNTYHKLVQCERLCFAMSENDIQHEIYTALDDVMMDFATTNDVPQYKDVVDQLWSEIESRQGLDGYSGIPFKFPTLNYYATIEPGELFIFAAEAKQGKSMMLLNCAVDLLKRDLSVLYLDSELNSRMFTCRLMSNLTGIEFSRVKSGNYNQEEAEKLLQAREWMKTRRFTHLYVPMFDFQSLYTAVRKIKHTQGLDVVIVDYFKSKSEGDAFASYQELGKLVDGVKNQICGELNIAGIGAAQATSTGKVADSAKIGRNASTIALLQDKTPEEIDKDGRECGNKKLRIVLNRNGAQQMDGEYIDLQFNGNTISYEEARQHTPVVPF